jgi:hypothetical protein
LKCVILSLLYSGCRTELKGQPFICTGRETQVVSMKEKEVDAKCVEAAREAIGPLPIRLAAVNEMLAADVARA